MIETALFDYGIVGAAMAAVFYLAHQCAGKTRDAIENNTRAFQDLLTWLKEGR